jgi:hypothetical protein
MVLDMQPDSKVSLILGRPFLSTANAHINVGAREIKFNINEKEERFAFKPRPELNTAIKMIEEDQPSRTPSSGSESTPEP